MKKAKENIVCLEHNGQIYSVPESRAKEFMEMLEEQDKKPNNSEKDWWTELEEIGDLYEE